MKTGKSIVELAQELQRIQVSKRDFTVPTSMVQMTDDAKVIFKDDVAPLTLNNHSAGQLFTHAEIPKAYADRIMVENPALLAKNVNHGLQRIAKARKPGQKPDGRLIRTLDGKMRGFLSSSYRILDAHDVLEATLPTLLDNKFQVVSSEITEKRLYLKTTSPRIQGEVAKGDVVQYGVMISTSDVGAGSLKIEPYLNRLVCLNGMVATNVFKKAHLGRNQVEADIQEILSNDTKRLNDAAFFATLRDYLINTMRPDVFQLEIEKMQQAAGLPIENVRDLERVVELSMNQVGIKGENAKNSILAALATGNEGAGLTMWGLANSFTRAAQDDLFDYDQATELERAGGEILNLNKSQWKNIAC
jgi:hypothetical protein